MEKKLCIKNYTSASITAVTYLPPKREVVAGFEDGLLKCWELESGRPTSSNHQHKGWVSQLLYWPEGKVMFSSSIDSTIVQWSSSFEPYHTIELAGPIYCMMWNPRRDQLICGRNSCLSLIGLSGKISSNGLPLLSKKEHKVEGHQDIVKCVTGMGNKAYSGGFDRKLFVYEVSNLPGAKPLSILSVNHHAHDAAITCLLVTRDSDNNTWIATGSYDQKVKIWTAEGKLMVSISCQSVVTGLCYVLPTKVLWAAAGSSVPIFLEPKIGDNISAFVPILGEAQQEKGEKSRAIQVFNYFPEITEVLGFSNLKEVLSWKYTTNCSICIQQSPSSGHIETITYTNKSPVLIFTGSYDGVMTKWERHQLNTFMFSCEQLSYKEKLTMHMYSEESEWNMLEVVGKSTSFQPLPKKGPLIVTEDIKQQCRQEVLNEDYRGFVRSLYVERLEYLIVSALDGKIFVWGYDESGMAMLLHMQKLLNGSADAVHERGDADRVAGMVCLQVLNGHSSAVSGMTLIEKGDNIYLISGGWDCYLCVWNLNNLSMVSRIKHTVSTAGPLAGDTIIMDLDYSDKCEMVAYSTSDSSIFLCPFTKQRTGLRVKATLKGHRGEVTQVKWNPFINKWVSGSEDGTIRIWPANGDSGCCDIVVDAGGPVTVLTIDSKHGLVLAAIRNVIKVYDQELEVVQVSQGHTDTIQSIIHVPELDMYFSAGWDKTMRLWKAYRPRYASSRKLNTLK